MKPSTSTFLGRLSTGVALAWLFLLAMPPAQAQTLPTCEAIGGTCRPYTMDQGCESGEQLDRKGTCDSNLKCCGSTSCEDRGGACQPNVAACAPGTSSLGNASCSTGLCCTLPTDGPTCGELVGNTGGRCIQSSDSCPDNYTNLGPTKDPCLSCCSPGPGPGPTPTPTPGGSEYKVEFLHTDALGSVRMVTDETGAVVSRSDYYPFGTKIDAGDTGRDAVEATYLDDPALRQRFTGKERDGESRLDYFGARYYSSAQGRFTAPDAPFADQDPTDPQSWNLFSYTRNNPVARIDSDGRFVATITGTIVGFATGVVVGAATGGDWLEDGKQGAVSGAVGGAIIDISLASGGTATVGVIALSGAYGGLAGGVYERGGLGTSEEVAKDVGLGAVSGVIGGKVGAYASEKAADAFVQYSATLATAAERVPGQTAQRLGIAAHENFDQRMGSVMAKALHLNGEKPYIGGKLQDGYRPAGSANPDAGYGNPNSPRKIYDLKTGKAGISPKQQAKYVAQVGIPAEEIRPKR